MKKKKYIFLISCFVSLAIINTTCNQYWNKKLTYKGTLYDTIGGIRMKGAVVELRACTDGAKTLCSTFQVGQTVTDASGHFVINSNAAREGRYFINVNGINILGGIRWYLLESDLYGRDTVIYLKAAN